MSIGPPIPGIQLFQNLTMKIQGQGHKWGQSWKSQRGSNIQSTHIPFAPCQSGIPFLSYNFFKIWPWKSRVKIMGEVKFQSHNVGLTSYRFTSLSFHVNRPSHSWVTTISKFDLANQGSRSWVRSHFNVRLISYWLTFLLLHGNRHFHSRDTAFSKFDLENPGSSSNDHDVAQLQV